MTQTAILEQDQATLTVPQFLHGKQPGHNIDRIDIAAGLRALTSLGWDPNKDARTFMVIEHALQRWARGEEAEGERLAIAQGETDPMFRAAAIDMTSWRVVLACAMAAAERAAQPAA